METFAAGYLDMCGGLFVFCLGAGVKREIGVSGIQTAFVSENHLDIASHSTSETLQISNLVPVSAFLKEPLPHLFSFRDCRSKVN